MTDTQIFLLQLIGIIAGMLIAYNIYAFIDDIKRGAIEFE